jgi:hypothetical protein
MTTSRWKYLHMPLSKFQNVSWKAIFLLDGIVLIYLAYLVSYPSQGYIHPLRSLADVICITLGTYLIVVSATSLNAPSWMRLFRKRIFQRPLWIFGWIVPLIIMTSVVGNAVFHYTPGTLSGNYYNDAMAFIHIDTNALLQGTNPYTHDDLFWQAVLRWSKPNATPILGGTAFGDNPLDYPQNAERASLLIQAKYPEFRDSSWEPKTVHNYPAGILWLAVPLIFLSVPSLVFLNVIALIAILILALRPISARDRIVYACVLLVNPLLITSNIFLNFDLVALFFVLAAWNFIHNARISPLLFGFACAIKQIAWFILPFYLIGILCQQGWKSALKRIVWIAAGFIIPNLPFIIFSPAAWLNSIFIPMTTRMFPLGIGAITLALGGIIPIGTERAWSCLVIIVTGVILGYLWHYRKRDIILSSLCLALIPLMFSWRSPINYFAAIPILAVWIMGIREQIYKEEQLIEIAS